MFLTTMPQLLSNPTPPGDIKAETARVWAARDATKRLGAHLAPWTDGTAADGVPLGPVERCPLVDYSEPGVVALTWRRGGVWVRLWAADTAAAPSPTPLAMPAKARTTAMPSGRLPIRRPVRTGPFTPAPEEFGDIHYGILIASANDRGDALVLGHHDPRLALAAFNALSLAAEMPATTAELLAC
uniref:hypothetical protein n=1 Tax=Streptomyces tubercidicus TaxID=47759 RepID=UPI0030DFF177